jgi:hypothetical protein
MLMRARRGSCSWRVNTLAGLLVTACVLACTPAGSAHAAGSLLPEAVTTTVQQKVAPVTTTLKRVTKTPERTARQATTAIQSGATQAAAPAAAQTTVAAATTTAHHTVRGTIARVDRKAPKHRRHTTKRSRPAQVLPHNTNPGRPATIAVATAPTQPKFDRAAAAQTKPKRTAPAATAAPAAAATQSAPHTTAASASAAGTSAAAAAAFLALLAIIAIAALRLGDLIRLRPAWAPMPPCLALPERPG